MSSAGSTQALVVSDLTVGYTGHDGSVNVVVWNADLTLETGSILGLAGESGCGKSTTALAAIGYRARGAQVLGGSAILDGDVDLLDLPLHQLRAIWGKRVAYVAQSASAALSPAMSVGAQLIQVLERHTELSGALAGARAEELFDAVGLPDPKGALRRYPHQFSGGQQQRIAIAIALACDPKVLVLDEPTTGLDVTTQSRIAALLRSLLADVGVAALYVSHDLSLLSSVADRLAVMYAGQIVEEGKAAELAVRPRHPYTRALLAAVPDVSDPRTLVGIAGAPPDSADSSFCSFSPRCAHVLEVCRTANPPLVEAAPRHFARCVRLAELGSNVLERIPIRDSVPVTAKRLLDVRDLWCEYRTNGATSSVVKGVSLDVAPGETVGIVGESGSGKSTLLRAIAGLHRPSKGSIWFDANSLDALAVKRSRDVRRELQLVFQNPDSSLNPRQTVLQILSRPIRMFRDEVPRARESEEAQRMLESVKLPASVLHRYPSQLSGGQKQRIAIARAFAAHPRLLLCDEVTSALDVSVQATILELIAELSTQLGTAVVFVSHDLAIVRTVTSRAFVMRSGEICESGGTARLFEAPQHPYTRELVEAVPPSPSALAAG
ncbi:MAG: peptide/nickel transport system ATP-binding protein ddpF [Gaiellales bacterium]|nr:peptide/nickel transport system ATP-binding protein ddpF [Gaiellales bacterium]